MDILEKLLQADINKAYELQRSTFTSKRLGKLIGEDTAEVVIKEIPQRKLNEIMAVMYDKNGNFKMEKTFDSKLMAIVEGVVSPNLKDSKLREHFNAATPKVLAETLFGSEVTALSDAIMVLSGEANENDIKN
ncbi:MAG: hypothetical protein ACI4GD_00575 [Lachnospiraceae bacterium]